MSTEIIRERPLINGLGGGSAINWIKLASQEVLSRKKHLILGLIGLGIVALAAFSFYA